MTIRNLHRRAAALPVLAVLLAGAVGCATTEPFVDPSRNVGTNIPVLVMSEDEDPNSVKRSSDIFKRVIAELKGAMQRHGFRMIDEESVAVDLGWKVRDRRKKTELIETVKLMNRSGKASHRVRAWVLFRIHAQAEELGFSTKVQTRIDGEIYDAASNQFLDTFEMPRETYPAPADCLDSAVCITEVVGDRAREIAAGLGEVLALKLERYSPPRTGGRRGSPGDTVTGERVRPDAPSPPPRPAPAPRREDVHGLLTPYTVTLRYFGNREAIAIVGVMADEFPGYRSHELLGKSAAVRRYGYVTTAKAAKLEEWLHILLADMGFDPERETLVQIDGTDIRIDKLVPTPRRPDSPDEKRRFR